MKIESTITSFTIIGGINHLVTVTGHEAMKLDANYTKDQLQHGNRRDSTSVR